MTATAFAFADRLRAAQLRAQALGVDAVLITPGADLRYLTGYHAQPLERLTCLVLPAQGAPVLVLPALELLAAQASPVADLDVTLRTFGETDDAIAIAAGLIAGASTCAVDDHMWAAKVLAFQAALPGCRFVTAGPVIHPLRMRKDAGEVDGLARAGAAIDAVHAQVPGLLRPGRSEREIGRDITELMLAAGHVAAEFVIVGSGPNSASPHHDVSDRVLEEGDIVVVDIGGVMPDGYVSDCTRTYAVGSAPADFAEDYAVLMRAQEAARAAVRPGVTCESIDAAARTVLEEAGLGAYFLHRTGHGIGLEAHEDPYIVTGNALVLEPGMAFSIEPGFYRSGQAGARIEDIVVCTESGARVLNQQPRELVIASGR